MLCKGHDIVAPCRAKEDNAETRTTVLAIETHHGKTSQASEQMTYIYETYCVCFVIYDVYYVCQHCIH